MEKVVYKWIDDESGELYSLDSDLNLVAEYDDRPCPIGTFGAEYILKRGLLVAGSELMGLRSKLAEVEKIVVEYGMDGYIGAKGRQKLKEILNK